MIATPAPTTPPEIGHVRVSAFCSAVRNLGPAIVLTGANDDIVKYSNWKIYKIDYENDARIRISVQQLDIASGGLEKNIERLNAILDSFHDDTSRLTELDAQRASAVRDVYNDFRAVSTNQKNELNELEGYIDTTKMIDNMRDVKTPGVSDAGRATNGWQPASLPKGSLKDMKQLRARAVLDLADMQKTQDPLEQSLAAHVVALAAPCNVQK